jgi:hypothetical protein
MQICDHKARSFALTYIQPFTKDGTLVGYDARLAGVRVKGGSEFTFVVTAFYYIRE